MMLASRGRARDVRLALVLSLSFALTAYVVLRNTSTPCGDLLGGNSDHLRDAHGTWVFLHRGLAIYRKLFGELAAQSTFRHPVAPWGDANWAYPPGLFAFFLPATLVGQWVPATQAQFGRWIVVYLLFFSHLALFAWMRLFKDNPLATLFSVVAFCTFVQMAFQGFHDQVWLGCAAMAGLAAQKHKPVRGLFWLSAAAIVSFRAAALAPLGAVLAQRSLRSPGPLWRRWSRLALPALVGIVDIYTFALFLRYAPGPGERFGQFMQSNVHLFPQASLDWAVFIASLGALAVLIWLRAWLIAAALLLGHAMAVSHGVMWWHASVLFPVAILATTVRLRERARVSATVLLWMLVLAELIFSYQPLHLLTEIIIKWPK